MRTERRPLDLFKFILRKILLAVLAIAVAFPVLYMISSSLFSAGDFNNLRILSGSPVWSNYAKALTNRYFPYYLVNSVGTALLAAIIRTTVVILAAFALTHLRFRGRNVILAALVLTLFVPQEAVLYHNYRTVASLGLLDSWAGIIATSLFSAAQMLLLMGAFISVGTEPYDAAQIDGASDLRYIREVLMPLTAPAIMTIAIQTLITVFNSYLWPLLVTNRPKARTLQIGITMLGFSESGQLGAQMATLVLMTIPFLVLLAFAKRHIENALIRR